MSASAVPGRRPGDRPDGPDSPRPHNPGPHGPDEVPPDNPSGQLPA